MKMSDTKKKIEDTDLNVDRLENLAKLVVDRWDLEGLIHYAREHLFQDYQYDIDSALNDVDDFEYTLEELDKDMDDESWEKFLIKRHKLEVDNAA